MTGPFSAPDWLSNRCPVCGEDIFLELIQPEGAALCPQCGLLFRRICGKMGVIEGQVTLSTSLADALGADSLDVVERIMELEEEYGVEISAERAKRVKTMGDLIALIESLRHCGR